MVDANVKIINELKLFLETVTNEADITALFSFKPEDFTRNRKLPLSKVAAMLINLPKRSLSIELREFFNIIDNGSTSCTKAAFCLQRAKLRAVFFAVWNKFLVENFYHYYGDSAKKWKGFKLLAVDGSTAYLFNKEEVIQHYGTSDNQHAKIPMARIMEYHDVLNELTIWGGIFPIKKSEKDLLINHIDHLPVDSLSLYDRGYPSYVIMYLLLNQESPRHFVMRCQLNFNNEVKDFIKSKQQSKIINLKPSREAIDHLYKCGFIVTPDTTIRIRMVKFKLSTGAQEVLLTSLYDTKKYTVKELKKLYGMRWGIETNYNKEKNQLQMEEFSGHKVICIEQDYAAGVFTSNLQSLVEKQTEEYIVEVNKVRKLNYKVNKNISWAALKNNIVKLFLENDCIAILNKLTNEFQQHLEPVRKGRSYPRVRLMRRTEGKYRTFTNYKRAI